MQNSRILMTDTTPLLRLAAIGQDALDWLFVPTAEVWVTDIVEEEVRSCSDEDDDHRALSAWFARNESRINVQTTDVGEERRKAFEAWRTVPGTSPELKPSFVSRESQVWLALESVEQLSTDGSDLIVVADDDRTRSAIEALDESVIVMSVDEFMRGLSAVVRLMSRERLVYRTDELPQWLIDKIDDD